MQDDQLIKISGAGEAGERGAEHGDLYAKDSSHNFTVTVMICWRG